MGSGKPVEGSDALLVKLRSSGRLRAAGGGTDLEPLHAAPRDGAVGFRVDDSSEWYLARGVELAETPWDQAHARVASQLGVDTSDVLFAEPDLVHRLHPEAGDGRKSALGLDTACDPEAQDPDHKKAVGPDRFAWHLEARYSQLGAARAEVQFSTPRTRIAHLDTGYQPAHETTPRQLREELGRNFVDSDGNPTSAADPDNERLFADNSGHGTGTLSILAGGAVSRANGAVLGGAPDAAVVPLRIADSVILFRTSAVARAIRYATELGCQVATLSMGGVPSRAWAEAVDDAYDAGLCVCAAAGNRYRATPPVGLVYPAHYARVIGVCGVMANGKPYKDLDGAFEGVFGPASAMTTAIASYTPNIPWAKFPCPDIVRLNGEGTSSATPQVAAAAALWIEKYKDVLPRDWRRVEAVRHALFSSAKLKSNRKHFGNGVLQARDALDVAPLLTFPKSRTSSNAFAVLRMLTGLGVDTPTTAEEMFGIELTQRWLLNEELSDVLPDPEAVADVSKKKLKRFMDALIADDGASLALRRHIASRYSVVVGEPVRSAIRKRVVPELPPVALSEPEVMEPAYRRLRVYAADPSLSRRLDTAEMNEVTLHVRWETLKKGPVGEYLAIDDRGPRRYAGVNLDEPALLAQDGWAPSEGNPQFHQQMVYAVSMKTIEHFERALGRPVLWRPKPNPRNPHDDKTFVQRLTVRPHAMQEANAYYSPHDVSLKFGYFGAREGSGSVPGSPIYTCLSHDIIAHETTHAILDGVHRRYNEPTNVDVLALHEAFADIVALLQHFTIPEVLEHQIAKTRGDLEADSLLGKLAVQFGQASRGRGALRHAIGSVVDGVWQRFEPEPDDLSRRVAPHARGAILVAAVFDALVAIYNTRVADLLRIYTGGTGVLPTGTIHPDLVGRLASEAAKSANHVLNMCIRALDYLPPVDVTFFDFLRAVITADFELVMDDRHHYRVAFVEAFTRRGIFPGDHDEHSRDGAQALSAETLRWPGFRERRSAEVMSEYAEVVKQLKVYAEQCLYVRDREQLFHVTRARREALHKELTRAFRSSPAFQESLGLEPGTFEVHALRRAMRTRLDGIAAPQVFVSLTQSRTVRKNDPAGVPRYRFRGGSTLVVDLAEPGVPKYRIVKNIRSKTRQRAAENFFRHVEADPLRRLFFSTEREEPFAALHGLAEEG